MNPEENPLKQIRTYQGDVAEALKKQQESLVSIQRREQMRRDSTGPSTAASSQLSERRREIFFLSLGSLLLFTIGTVGAWYAYQEFIKRSSTPILAGVENRFVSTNTEVSLNLATTSRETLINKLFEAKGGVPNGELKHIILRKDVGDRPLLRTSEFLEILNSQAPGNLVRAFDPLFMFGSFKGSLATDETSTFLIIKLASFENAFAGMLAWEEHLAEDLGPLFATATLFKNVAPESTFVDVIDRNKDIRMLMLGEQPVLLYSFFDNNLLIITDHIETMRTLVDRLTREKLSR